MSALWSYVMFCAQCAVVPQIVHCRLPESPSSPHGSFGIPYVIIQKGKNVSVTFKYELRFRSSKDGSLRLYFRDAFDETDLRQRQRVIPVESRRVVPIFGELFLCELSGSLTLHRVTDRVKKTRRPSPARRSVVAAPVLTSGADVRPFDVTKITTSKKEGLAAHIRVWMDSIGPMRIGAKVTKIYQVGDVVEVAGIPNVGYRIGRIVPPYKLTIEGVDGVVSCPGWVEFETDPVRLQTRE